MEPTLILALAKLGLTHGIDIVRTLLDNGWEPTNEELQDLRDASKDKKAEWDALGPPDD